ncbi:hypothetical protein B0H17DRAFT_1196883 [Mycena rosella]|uniref:Uncharacterized protein n=1 Tax=Mycena rosella TaxID=1033263 RepID=A0AAD7GJY8_MYCRO|nr:hypothetical protein B0H17DRAFT_1196883 [Mycena rosella]
MARTKTAKPKEMFKAYDPDAVPDFMPFPPLSHVVTAKGGEAAVPKLNDHQRSWILDIGLRNLDLPGLTGKAALNIYNRIKSNAFDAKAFQHTGRSQDRAEEATLLALVTAWKQQQKNKKPNATDDGEASNAEEDEDGRGGLLRGYSKVGWRVDPFCLTDLSGHIGLYRPLSLNFGFSDKVIQKVISNKRSAAKCKTKADKTKTEADDAREGDTGKQDAGESAPAESRGWSKLLGLAAYSGRDKFSDDRHDTIHEYSKTLPGPVNAGGKFRMAERLLWEKEDQAAWEAAAAADENVDWVERQQLVTSGFRQMVNNLHASRKFRPFVATMLMGWLSEDGRVQLEWAEAVPEGIHVNQTFEKQHLQLVQDLTNATYTWAENPLKEYATDNRKVSMDGAPPVFGLSADDLAHLTPIDLTQQVTTFLTESYGAAFGIGDVPWDAIAGAPDDYYDAALLLFRFPSTGPAELTIPQWYELANTLASVAGAGTSGFFRNSFASADSTTGPFVLADSTTGPFALTDSATGPFALADSTTAASAAEGGKEAQSSGSAGPRG